MDHASNSDSFQSSLPTCLNLLLLERLNLIKSIKSEEIGDGNGQMKSEQNFLCTLGVNLLKYTNHAVFIRTFCMFGH